jgi:ParB family chromosome partitioning protein
MAKKRKVDFSLASEIFEDASLTDSFPEKVSTKTAVPLSRLMANPYQPRIEIVQDAIIELANSISENGLLQPITVLENDDETFTIVFGHRRVAAFEYLNKTEIPANILTSLDNKDLVIAPIVENLQRKDMEPIETAMALNRVLKMGIVKTQNDLSTSLGISQGRISKLLSILKLSDDLLIQVKKANYKDVTVLAALNKVVIESQSTLFNLIKILPRNEALLKIKDFLTNKQVSIKRIVHGNHNIKINTKGLSKETKEQVLNYVREIEYLLKEGKSNE